MITLAALKSNLHSVDLPPFNQQMMDRPTLHFILIFFFIKDLTQLTNSRAARFMDFKSN